MAGETVERCSMYVCSQHHTSSYSTEGRSSKPQIRQFCSTFALQKNSKKSIALNWRILLGGALCLCGPGGNEVAQLSTAQAEPLWRSEPGSAGLQYEAVQVLQWVPEGNCILNLSTRARSFHPASTATVQKFSSFSTTEWARQGNSSPWQNCFRIVLKFIVGKVGTLTMQSKQLLLPSQWRRREAAACRLVLKEKSPSVIQIPITGLWVAGEQIPESSSSSRQKDWIGQFGHSLCPIWDHLRHHWWILQQSSKQLIVLSEGSSLAGAWKRVCWFHSGWTQKQIGDRKKRCLICFTKKTTYAP